MPLVVLSNFRDLVFSQGPGFQSFLSSDRDLSGTSKAGPARLVPLKALKRSGKSEKQGPSFRVGP
jgi:hypothetical protein